MATSAGMKRKAETTEGPAKAIDAGLPESSSKDTKSMTPAERMIQFRALRLRAKESKKENRHSLYQENSRMRQDPKELKKLEMQKAIAEEKLAKLDALEAGESFERKRAWDWTVEQSQAWDEKMAQKKHNKDNAGFADYTQEASKQYERNTQSFKPDLEAYAAQKALQEKAAGPSQLVIASDGTLMPSTQAKSYGDLNNLSFVNSKPSKESIDNLISSMSKTDAARLKASQRRSKGKEGDDVTYINNRNRVFNEKVARFYDKYEHTKEMRDNFERGSAQ